MVDDHRPQESQTNKEQEDTSGGTHSSLARENCVSVWTTIGERCADFLCGQFRFDREERQWYEWRDGTHWVEIKDKDTAAITDVLHNDRLRIAADLGDQGRHDLRDLLADDNAWRRATASIRGEWWAALRKSLARDKPLPGGHEVATPDGVVDVLTGKIQPHDPLRHDTMAVANGRYRPQEIERLKSELWNRLRHNLNSDDFEQLITILGVAVARRCVDYCSILWLVGKSGSGKSATANLILDAYGGLGLGASADLLARQARSDIDAELADLLQVDPTVICISEVEKVGISRLLALSGGDELGARRPHGRMQRGRLSGLVIVTSVVPPKMTVDTGVRRRVLVLDFPTRIDDSVAHNRNFSQSEFDAIITLSLASAHEVGRCDWTPPTGNILAKQAFLAEADPVSDWLHSQPDELHGSSFQEVLAKCNRELPEPTNQTALGRCVSASDRWDRRKNKETRRDHLILVGN